MLPLHYSFFQSLDEYSIVTMGYLDSLTGSFEHEDVTTHTYIHIKQDSVICMEQRDRDIMIGSVCYARKE